MKVGCQIRGVSGSRCSLKSDMGRLWRWIETTFSFLQKLSFGSLRLSISMISHGIRESRIGRSYPHLGTYHFFGVFCQKRIPFQCWVKTNLANFDDQLYPHLVTHLFFGVFCQKRIPFKWWAKSKPCQFWWLACSSLSWILFLLKKSSQDFGIALDPTRSLLSFCYLSTTVFHSYIHGLLTCVFKLLNLSRWHH